jgi:hypothetical protein
MNQSTYKTPQKKEHCLTYDEASKILQFLLDHDLQYFLQEHGFIDEFGIPYESQIGSGVFKSVYFEKGLMSRGYYKRFYITQSGLKEFFNVALSRYLLERLVPNIH